MPKIKDFGEKIGGARKDLWKLYGMQIEDLLYMNEAEKQQLIRKDNIWSKPDYEKLHADGLPVRVVYFMKMVRDACPIRLSVPASLDADMKDDLRKRYIHTIQEMRDLVMNLKTESDVLDFYKKHFLGKYVVSNGSHRFVDVPDEYQNIVDNKLLKAVQVNNFFKYDRDITKKKFCYSDEEKLLSNFKILQYDVNKMEFRKDYSSKTMIAIKTSNGESYIYPEEKYSDPVNWENEKFFVLQNRNIIENNIESYEEAKQYALKQARLLEKTEGIQKKQQRKGTYIPPQLKDIERIGTDYRKGKNIIGDNYLTKFGFRGGEFGNWLSSSERQQSLNYGYDALMDLSRTLQINPADLSLDHHLSIAFGARGSKKSPLAHYEPLREVINLTKMRGAGSLAHEWAHALDNAIGKRNGCEMATEHMNIPGIPESLKKLVHTMCFKKEKPDDFYEERTEFYKNSILFDTKFAKTDNGYWQSKPEMFARAFECYIADKLDKNGQRSDYLCGLAGAYTVQKNENGKPDDKEIITAFPKGEERKSISLCFDAFFLDLKKLELLHEFDLEEEEKSKEKDDSNTSQPTPQPIRVDNNGQSLFDFEQEYER
ncbi:hypothetical protein MKC74_03925 [[Clostridium] innocuum]|nr:hypothetical protein [[Clostridium] innocuum]